MHKEEDSGVKTLNEVKPLENINENCQDFLGITYEETKSVLHIHCKISF